MSSKTTKTTECKTINAKYQELIKSATEEIKKAFTMQKYEIHFYTLDDLSEQCDPSYSYTATQFELDRLKSMFTNPYIKELKYLFFDETIVNITEFAVIEWEPIEEDEEDKE